jgi:hypothetical protein
MMDGSNYPTLKLPENRVQQEMLKKKLAEWSRHLSYQRAPEERTPFEYKIQIANAILRDGEADCNKIAAEMRRVYGHCWPHMFKVACMDVKKIIG